MTEPSTEEKRRSERRTHPGRREDDKDPLEELVETLKKEMQKGFDQLTARLSGFIKKALIGFAILGISCAVALGGFTMVLRAYQNQRYNVFVTNCEDSNDRNKKLLDRDNQRIWKLPIAQQKKALKQSEPYREIINTAFPYRKNCASYARARLKGERG